MPCYHPLTAWQRSKGSQPVFKPIPDGSLLLLPCGQCVGCRLERSRQWALRCVHEASLYDDNCFLTLTYSDDSLSSKKNPLNLEKSDFQKFLKRLRKSCNSKNIRYYACGEYGELTQRPHFHACVFNHDFHDKELHTVINGQPLYMSDFLERLWPYGFSSIGALTFESAAYVARYVMKKITGSGVDDVDPVTGLKPYQRVDERGVVYDVTPEFNLMSLKPGIGFEWWQKYKSDLRKDFITHRGVKQKPPRFYDKLLERYDPDFYLQIKEQRAQANQDSMDEALFTDRLSVKEQVKINRLKMLKRSL